MTLFKKSFDKDWTNLSNKLPDLNDVIGPYDVLTLEKMYIKYGGQDLRDDLFLNKLGIPVRDTHGKIINMPTSGNIF